uniref:Putative secreted protein n=1 Tax=Ixodes ricinus TaxID=34613 RepID=A0A147BWB0_IXORI
MVFFILCYFALLLEGRVLAPSCPRLGSPLTGPGCWRRKSLSCSCDVSTVPPVRGWRPASAMPTADRPEGVHPSHPRCSGSSRRTSSQPSCFAWWGPASRWLPCS